MNEDKKMPTLQLDEFSTVGRLLDNSAAVHGDRTALLYPQRDSYASFSYRELQQLAIQVAKGVMALGMEPSEHAAIWSPNLSEYVLTQFGCAKVGIPLVPINPGFQTYELEYILKQSDTTTLFLADGAGREGEYLDAIREICLELNFCLPGKLRSARLPALRNIICFGVQHYPGMYNWKEFMNQALTVDDQLVVRREQSVIPDDLFIIQYTSGTTGFSKGAMLSHVSYVLNAIAIANRQGRTSQDVICVPLPLSSSYGFLATLVAIAIGATAVIMKNFRGRDLLKTIEECKVTFVYGAPTIFKGALDALSEHHSYDLSSLCGGSISGSHCSPELVKAIIDKLGTPEMGIHYGSSETLVTVMNSPEVPLSKRMSTIGQAMPTTEVKIVDLATGQQVPMGEQGELCIKGPTLMKGYYKLPDITANIIDDAGWLHSGDLGCVDAEGYYSITGRIKDVIIRGGENIYPAEIEEFLSTHPKVLDAQVVGIPSPYYGEIVVAFVRLRSGEILHELDLKRFCRQQIGIQRVPSQFFFIKEYPMTYSGKVQKNKLQEIATQLMGTDMP